MVILMSNVEVNSNSNSNLKDHKYKSTTGTVKKVDADGDITEIPTPLKHSL